MLSEPQPVAQSQVFQWLQPLKFTLPMGLEAEMVADAGTITMLQPTVTG